VTLETFVHATKPIGWFRFKGVPKDFQPVLETPAYEKETDSSDTNPVSGQDLCRLGYEQRKVMESTNLMTYYQKGWGGFYYEIAVIWKQSGKDELAGPSLLSPLALQPGPQVP